MRVDLHAMGLGERHSTDYHARFSSDNPCGATEFFHIIQANANEVHAVPDALVSLGALHLPLHHERAKTSVASGLHGNPAPSSFSLHSFSYFQGRTRVDRAPFSSGRPSI
jgi:hypothetical protein